MKTPPRSSSSQARLGGWLATMLELLEVRLELLALEARSEAGGLLRLLVMLVAGTLLLVFALAFAAVFITAALWEQHALAALAAFTLLFACGGGALLWGVRQRLARMDMFRATRAELQADRQRLHTPPEEGAPHE